MTKLLRDHRWFFIPYLMLLAFAAVGLLLIEKGDFVLWLNDRHGVFADEFFRYATLLGDGILITAVLIALLILYPRAAIAGSISTIVTSLVIQFLKRSVFKLDRPIRYFADRDLNLVEGVDMHSMFSFPSGHAGGAFALFCTLALLSRNNGVNVLLLLTAAIVALSRVYLAQHFLVDVVAGSFIGVFFSISAVCLLNRSKRFRQNVRLDKPLFGLLG